MKKRQIDKRTREAIQSQIKNEIEVAREHKRPFVARWQKNEDLLFESERFKLEYDTRSQVALHKMNGFIQTILSKIDDPLTFKFGTKKIASKKKVEKYNALKEIDSDRDNWSFKDLLGKKQSSFYGRTIYFYFATGDKKQEYKPNLNLIDVYDFLIDPKAGGLDMQKARYMGHFNVRYSKKELEEGAKSGKFIKEVVKNLIESGGNENDTTEEEINKDNRFAKYNSYNRIADDTRLDDYVFWAWFTTYQGKKYYCLFSETNSAMIKVQELSDFNKSDCFPYWSYACFPDLAEFWTQSYADIARDIIMAQSVSINQMMDNAERVNNPQRVINTTALVDENELRYKKRGFIRTNSDVRGVFEEFQTPSIDTPLAVYEALETILGLQSGVTGATQGIAEEEKVGIYEGNQVAVADRFNLFNKSYSNGYKYFAKLWKEGVDLHLEKDIAVKLIGNDGVEVETSIGKNDITYEDFEIYVESGNSESQATVEKQRNKIAFLTKYASVPFVNPKATFEIEADIAGFSKDEVKRLLDPSDTTQDIIVELHRDIEDILSGKEVEPNEIADTFYAQELLDYIKDKKENITADQYNSLREYLTAIQPIVQRNMVRKAQQKIAEMGMLGEMGGVPNVAEQPPEPIV